MYISLFSRRGSLFCVNSNAGLELYCQNYNPKLKLSLWRPWKHWQRIYLILLLKLTYRLGCKLTLERSPPVKPPLAIALPRLQSEIALKMTLAGLAIVLSLFASQQQPAIALILQSAIALL